LISDSTPYMNEIVAWFSLVEFPNVPSYPLHGSRDGDELGTLDGCLLGSRHLVTMQVQEMAPVMAVTIEMPFLRFHR
jgi:hypothetical protein